MKTNRRERMISALTAAIFAFAPVSSGAMKEEKSAEKAIRQVLEEQVKAWNRQDLDGYLTGYWNSPNLTFYSGDAITRGWQATRDRYRRRYRSEGREMGRLTFSDLIVERLDRHSAFVRGRWQLVMTAGKPPQGLFTLIVRKLPEGWRIVHDHTSTE